MMSAIQNAAALRRRAGGLRDRLSSYVSSFIDDESGATAIEYTLIVALIFLTIVGAIRAYSQTTSEMYSTIETTLTNANE